MHFYRSIPTAPPNRSDMARVSDQSQSGLEHHTAKMSRSSIVCFYATSLPQKSATYDPNIPQLFKVDSTPHKRDWPFVALQRFPFQHWSRCCLSFSPSTPSCRFPILSSDDRWRHQTHRGPLTSSGTWYLNTRLYLGTPCVSYLGVCTSRCNKTTTQDQDALKESLSPIF